MADLHAVRSLPSTLHTLYEVLTRRAALEQNLQESFGTGPMAIGHLDSDECCLSLTTAAR